MKLKDLLKNITVIKQDNINLIAELKDIVDDTRKIKKNYGFVAIKGINIDAHNYIPDAISRGASVIFYEHRIDPSVIKNNPDVSFILTDISRKTLAILASNWYGNPSEKMKIVGITGTNGKTTTSSLVYDILTQNGLSVGLITSVEAKIGDKSYDTGFHVTNPEPLQLHKFLNKMVENSCDIAVIEITSHGIDQYRHYGIDFDITAITNVTPEHLDYHKTFKNYLETKARIFEHTKKAIVNTDQPHFDELRHLLPKTCILVEPFKYSIPAKFSQKFPGDYNVKNAALAWEICKNLGLKVSEIKDALSNVHKIKGRFQYAHKGLFDIVIDFAHDAAALGNVLRVAKEMYKDGKVISVFGCAGLRDFKKRPLMGKVAKAVADIVIITAEDPRTEDLDEINRSIESGVLKAGGTKDKTYFIIPDRQKAIDYAIKKIAKRGDVVVITGKGHEKSMCYGTTEYPWSDLQAVKKALS